MNSKFQRGWRRVKEVVHNLRPRNQRSLLRRLTQKLTGSPEARVQYLISNLNVFLRIFKKREAVLIHIFRREMIGLVTSPSASPARAFQIISSNLQLLMLIYKNDSKELMQIVELATWKHFVTHVIAVLSDDYSHLLIADETNRSVAQTILGYGRDGPGLAIHKMLAEVLFGAGGSHVNPSLDRTVQNILDNRQLLQGRQKAEASTTDYLMDLARLHGILSAAATVHSQKQMREVVVAGLANYGFRFSYYVNLSSRYEPGLYAKVAEEERIVLTAWEKGFNATKRADEIEARARYFLEALDKQPNLARVAADHVLSLPPGHTLRDDAKIRDALNTQLKLAIDSVAVSNTEEHLSTQTSNALNAIAGLIEHELVSAARLESLLNAGKSLLASPHLRETGGTFRKAAVTYLMKRASKARQRGETTLAQQCDAEVIELLTSLRETETDPLRKQILSLARDQAAGESGKAEETTRSLAELAPGEGQAEAARLFAIQVEARKAFTRKQYDHVISLLAPVRALLEEEYLSSVLERDLATNGRALSEASAHLAFSYAYQNDWKNALRVLDLGKSPRFRYQALFRAGPLGEFLRDLEADIHAQSRGIPPPTATRLNMPASLTDLLETYRQSREKIGFDKLQSPDLADIAARLATDEAVVVLGVGPDGMLMSVIRPGDEDHPYAHQLFSSEDRARLFRALTDMQKGWFIALGFGSAFVEPRTALLHLLDKVDEIIGQPLAALLKPMPVRRLTIIPHNVLHLVPFWALKSLTPYQVMLAPSAAQFASARTAPRQIEPQALVVGNPTKDLKLAALEAERVAAQLRKSGCTVELVEGADATEPTLTKLIAGSSILHFSGHSRSDLVLPTRSALETHPTNEPKTSEGEDLLLKLAEKAEWRSVHRLAGDEWIEDHNEHWADFPDHGRLVRRLYPSTRRIELRLEYAVQGTLLGRYEWLDAVDEIEAYGERYRLSELWTAGDILIDGSFRNCAFTFLSSCEAGLGGVGFYIDEFAGLPAALHLAGVATIVSPLWPVGVEVAAVFADFFYANLMAAHGDVDILALVQRTQAQLRRLNRDQAIAAITELGEGNKDRLTRLLLDAACNRIKQSDEQYPFAHPYDWAAFQVTGAPTAIIPFTSPSAIVDDESSTNTPSTEVDQSASVPIDQTEPPVVTDEITESSSSSHAADDVFESGRAAEILANHEPNEALRPFLAEEIYKRGQAYQRARDLDKALADFVRALELNPDFVKARISLGLLYDELDRHEEAIAHYQIAIEQAPNSAGALVALGFSYTYLSNPDAAIKSFERAIEVATDEDTAHLAHQSLAAIFLDAALYQQAEAHWTKALMLQPENALSYIDRASALRALTRRTEAIADVNRALFFLPESAIAYNLRGLILRDSEQYKEALSDFAKALGLDPSMKEALFNRGLVYSDLKEYEKAIPDFDAAIKLEPIPIAYTNRGLVHGYMGQYELALSDHNQALSLDPRNLAAFFNRACMYSLKQEAGSIVEDLRAALDIDPSVVDQARSDPDLEWARQTLPEVRELLSSYPST